MNTIGVEFSNFICKLFGLEFGKNFFYPRVPDEEAPVYWMTLMGSLLNRKLKTHQNIKEYVFVLNYRDVKAQNVDEKIFEIETVLNHLTCSKLEHFDLYEITTSNLGTYEDVDSEGRFKGSIQIVVKVHDDYHI